MIRFVQIALLLLTVGMFQTALMSANAKTETKQTWSQWRGPSRDGKVAGPVWPERLSEKYLVPVWRTPLSPSYSGPIVSETAVFVTETKGKASEIVRALDRTTGKELWKVEWDGAISVPFFAKSRGDWIRATPAYDGKNLFVAGMRDILVSLDAKTGKENWRVDFTKQFKTNAPEFGLVCSPLIDGDSIYIQAANSVVKLNKNTGKISWRSLESAGSIMESGAFSSPILADIAGRRQLIIQTREKLAGLDPIAGTVLWQQTVPSFRGMNILTPVVNGDTIFTSSYQNKSWLYSISKTPDSFKIEEAWNNTAQGYMSTPVVIDGYAYLHLGNQRFTCINLKTGERMWTSPKPFGQYWSLVAQGDRILALDEQGRLLLIKANPKQFEVLDERKISEDDTWAHLAVCGNEIFVRELNAMTSYTWATPKP